MSEEKKARGFRVMDEVKRKAIASAGGKAAHKKGTAHQFTPESAKEAGKKGGVSISRNREHMSNIGRVGGKKRGTNAKAKKEAEKATSCSHGGVCVSCGGSNGCAAEPLAENREDAKAE